MNEVTEGELVEARARNKRRHYASAIERAQGMLQQYEDGQSATDIARAHKVKPRAVWKFMLTHTPQEWKATQVAKALHAYECAKDEIESLKKSKGDARAQVRLACAREQLRSSQWELERLFADFYGQKSHVIVENVGDLAERLRRARERVVPQDVVDAEVVHTQQTASITHGVDSDSAK